MSDQTNGYEIQLHKDFNPGDVVTDGKTVGIVLWTKNEAMDLAYWKGYMFVHFTIGGNEPCIVRRDNYCHVSQFFESKHRIDLTMCEINELKKILSGFANPIVEGFLEAISKIK